MHYLKTWKISAHRKPLILRGARQVGKTYILKEFGETEFSQYHYVNFEEDERLELLFRKDLNTTRILDELQLFMDCPIDQKQDLVVFDEIQRCPRALMSLKYFCEEKPKLALCAAGSLLGINLNQESFPVGKVNFLDLRPMTFEEFLGGIGKTRFLSLLRSHDLTEPFPDIAHERLWELWKLYLVVGGLPEAVNVYRENKDNLYKALQAVRSMQRDLIDTYMADIAKHSGKVNALHVERLWRNVPKQLAKTLDGSAIKFRFKNAIPGFRGYEQISAPLGWLEVANLLIRTSIVERAAIPLSGFARGNRFKLYFFDVGLLGAVSGISPSVLMNYDFGSYKGYIAENFIAQELRAAGFLNLYCWQGRTSEIEFLLETDTNILPVEVKSGHVTHSKSLKVFEERYHPLQSYVLSAKNLGCQSNRCFLPLYAIGNLAQKVIEKSFALL